MRNLKNHVPLLFIVTISLCSTDYGMQQVSSLLSYGSSIASCLAPKVTSIIPSQASNFFSASSYAATSIGLGFAALKIRKIASSEIYLKPAEKNYLRKKVQMLSLKIQKKQWKYSRKELERIKQWLAQDITAGTHIAAPHYQAKKEAKMQTLYDIKNLERSLRGDQILYFLQQTLYCTCLLGSLFFLTPTVKYLLNV